MLGRIAALWASKTVSNILIGVLAAVLFAGYAYVKNQQTCCRVCKAQQAQNDLVTDLVDKLSEKYGAERDEIIQQLIDSDDPCLDAVIVLPETG